MDYPERKKGGPLGLLFTLLLISPILIGIFFGLKNSIAPGYQGTLTHEILGDPELFQQWVIDQQEIWGESLGSQLGEDISSYSKAHPEDSTLVHLRLRQAQEGFAIKQASLKFLKSLGN